MDLTTSSPTSCADHNVQDAEAFLALLCDNTLVSALEETFLQYDQTDLHTETVIHGGVCTRTIFIAAGTILTGAMTNLPNTCIVDGDISVTTDAGVVRLTGYNILTAQPGAKRVGIAHKDTYWTTVWHTDETTVAEAEDEFTPEAERLQSRQPGFRKD